MSRTVGTNKRYSAHFDRLMDQRILEGLATDGDLQTLTDTEIGLGRVPLTIDPDPKPVVAWVRFGTVPILVDAEACRWTPDAVGIRFAVGDTEHRAWVWASAINPASAPPRSRRTA